MKTEEFNKALGCYTEQINAELNKILEESDYSPEFKKVLEYALFPGGKRLRPVLVLEWHSVFAPADGYALRYACGIEILHSYSLIHDDMPCMDNDELRRGKPTVHKQFGEGTALLAGDALMDLAYGILGAPTPNDEASPFCMFSSMCGGRGLIQGQYLDLFGKIDNVEDLLNMYEFKTGALILLSCISGYALGNNLDYKSLTGIVRAIGEGKGELDKIISDERLSDYVSVCEFGKAFGTAFQLYDDITEYIDGEKISQTSIINFVDLDEAKRMLNDRLNDAAKALNAVNGDTAFLHELLNKFVIL